MTLFVRAAGASEYHWCENCSKYPDELANMTHTRPEGYLCEECEAQEKAGDCDGDAASLRSAGWPGSGTSARRR